MEKTLDIQGKELKIGTVVAYPCRRSSSCFLRIGIVERLHNGWVVVKSTETGTSNWRRNKDVSVITA